ncbi:hypothetical protein HYC85_002692 [Camellia sinensis]|uniref:Conserved oligomeric Golgi complex subunit 3 N-terminal domain-containing protein n=1 Tax=Camellia sinensis TaxID=4442 RepID=A0A7J7I8Z9_CAMSI|nr:hypothetical protein HYC85_002692 [Camellia sinensis]
MTSDKHQAVATKAKTLHDACDRLLIKKQRFIEFAEALHSKLKYFDELENRMDPTPQWQLQQLLRLMASTFPLDSVVVANKCMNLLFQQQQSDTQRVAAALMMGEDMHKFERSRLDRNEFPMNGGLEMVSRRMLNSNRNEPKKECQIDANNFFPIGRQQDQSYHFKFE